MEIDYEKVLEGWIKIRNRANNLMSDKVDSVITFKEYSMYYGDLMFVLNAIRYEGLDYLMCLKKLYNKEVILNTNEEKLKYSEMQEELSARIKREENEKTLSKTK